MVELVSNLVASLVALDVGHSLIIQITMSDKKDVEACRVAKSAGILATYHILDSIDIA